MKRYTALLCLLLCASLLAACAGAPTPAAEPAPEPEETFVPCEDGRDRPSTRGRLQVCDGQLCGEDGESVMLRGVSSYGLPMGESFINEALFEELSREDGVNLFRLALYTWGVGIVGYCTEGDRERLKEDIRKGVELAEQADMYVIVDWHILQDGDPNTYAEEARAFFAEMAGEFAGKRNVLYEICNEPNGVSWEDICRYAREIIPVIREKDPDSVIIVGTPDWSRRVDEAAKAPLAYENLLYTLHFYAASHKEELRETLRAAREEGLPIFVTEYGITASSGGFPRDTEEADRWIALLEEKGISYCMWSFSKVAEPCSAIRSNCLKYSGFTEEDYTETGLWLLETLKKHG